MATYNIEIAEYNSSGIRSEAAALGITHMRELAHTIDRGESLRLFALPHPAGYEIRVLDTNGDPVWEEQDPASFAEALEEAGIDA